ncbi:hypothetical protein G6F32_015191 [Rhizopus arrhizus]|nr:hypothetical protein G6F32_015191 [Rhizopus arrhizus]
MLHRTGTPGGDQRHLAQGPCLLQLRDIVATAHAIAVHAVQNDFAGPALLCLHDPVQGAHRHRLGLARVTAEATHAPLPIGLAHRVDTDHHALHA